MNELKAARCRIAANWLIFGSFIIGLLACVIRLVLVMNEVVNFDRYVLPNGTRLALPLDMIILIAAVAVLMIVGVILLIRSAGYAKRAAAEEKELLAEDDDEADSAYIEKDLTQPAQDDGPEPVLPAEEPAAFDSKPVFAADPCEEHLSRRKGGRPRKKGMGIAAKTALVAIPVVLTAVATAVVLKSAENNRRAKRRHRFYDWLG